VSGVTFGTFRLLFALLFSSLLLNRGKFAALGAAAKDSPLEVAGVKRGVDGEPGRGKFRLGGRKPRANGLVFNWLSSLDAFAVASTSAFNNCWIRAMKKTLLVLIRVLKECVN